MFVFDFDRVLFDTDGFIEAFNRAGLGNIPRGAALVTAIDEAGIVWEDFVHEGVVTYLKEHGQNCAIVSSYVSRNRLDNDTDEQDLAYFQAEKIRRSGLESLVARVLVTGVSKDNELRELAVGQSDLLLVDDETEHLMTASELGYKAVLFRTDKNKNLHTDKFLSVGSFTEFVQIQNG